MRVKRTQSNATTRKETMIERIQEVEAVGEVPGLATEPDADTTAASLRVSIFGMGYVGCVTAACLAEDGHRVTGVDVSPAKLEALGAGVSPVDEPGLGDIIRRTTEEQKLRVTDDPRDAIANTDISFVCVGTPSAENGSLNLDYVIRVCEEIGRALAAKENVHLVVIRSTMLPGTMRRSVIPALESASGKREGTGFYCVSNPEFLREGSGIHDYRKPPYIVVGADHEPAHEMMRQFYQRLDAPLVETSLAVAEMVKYTANAWHALKITFANEIGEICRAASVDSHEVMNIFCRDETLNISRAYLRPGFAFGGSCLPKDLRALLCFARHNDVEIPVLEHVNPSNRSLIDRVTKRILASGKRRIGIYGLSFKPNTDDLRESPIVSVVESLIGKGSEGRIFDETIQPLRLTGANKEYIDRHLPHIVQFLVDDFDALEAFSDYIIVNHRTERASAWLRNKRPETRVFDLVHLGEETRRLENYQGVSW